MSRSLSDGTVRWEAASNFHSGTGGLGGFVQHVFRLPAHSQLRTLKLGCGAANLKTLSIIPRIAIPRDVSGDRGIDGRVSHGRTTIPAKEHFNWPSVTRAWEQICDSDNCFCSRSLRWRLAPPVERVATSLDCNSFINLLQKPKSSTSTLLILNCCLSPKAAKALRYSP
jgi:hypothetical protein